MNSKWPYLLILWVWRMTGCRVLRPLSVPPLDFSEGNTVSSMYQDEEKYRRTLWEEEEKKIDEHNAEYGQDQTGIYASLNEFSDMTYEEFRKVCCGNLMWVEDLDCDKHEYKDLTKDNNVTPEKDQEPSASRSDPCDGDKAEQGKNRRRNSRGPLQYRG